MSFASLLGRIALWAALYVACAYLSFALDDPVTQVSFVWFPAGVAVAAFFAMPRAAWAALTAALFAADLALSALTGHPLIPSAWLAGLSLASTLGIAWLSQRYAQGRDDLHAVLGWVAVTFVVSAVAAVCGSAGLALIKHEVLWEAVSDLAWIWWAATVTGVLFGVSVLMGFTGFRTIEAPPGPIGRTVGIAAWLLLAAMTWYVFGVHRPSMSEAPLLLGLACIPLALATVATLSGGNRMGSLAVLTMAAIVIYHSNAGRGPFFLRGFLPGEPLLLAQCYLVSVAMLQVFVRVLTRGIRRPRTAGADGTCGRETLYRLDLASGTIVWDAPPDARPGPGTLDEVLRQVHPDDRQGLRDRLRAADGTPGLERPFPFRLATAPDQWTTVVDLNRGAMMGPDGAFIIGSWRLPTPHHGA